MHRVPIKENEGAGHHHRDPSWQNNGPTKARHVTGLAEASGGLQRYLTPQAAAALGTAVAIAATDNGVQGKTPAISPRFWEPTDETLLSRLRSITSPGRLQSNCRSRLGQPGWKLRWKLRWQFRWKLRQFRWKLWKLRWIAWFGRFVGAASRQASCSSSRQQQRQQWRQQRLRSIVFLPRFERWFERWFVGRFAWWTPLFPSLGEPHLVQPVASAKDPIESTRCPGC